MKGDQYIDAGAVIDADSGEVIRAANTGPFSLDAYLPTKAQFDQGIRCVRARSCPICHAVVDRWVSRFQCRAATPHVGDLETGLFDSCDPETRFTFGALGDDA